MIPAKPVVGLDHRNKLIRPRSIHEIRIVE
jgi:hypothetical protein